MHLLLYLTQRLLLLPLLPSPTVGARVIPRSDEELRLFIPRGPGLIPLIPAPYFGGATHKEILALPLRPPNRQDEAEEEGLGLPLDRSSVSISAFGGVWSGVKVTHCVPEV